MRGRDSSDKRRVVPVMVLRTLTRVDEGRPRSLGLSLLCSFDVICFVRLSGLIATNSCPLVSLWSGLGGNLDLDSNRFNPPVKPECNTGRSLLSSSASSISWSGS